MAKGHALSHVSLPQRASVLVTPFACWSILDLGMMTFETTFQTSSEMSLSLNSGARWSESASMAAS